MPIISVGVLAALFHAAAAAHLAVPLAERPVVRILVQSEDTRLERAALAEIVGITRDIWRPYADVTFDLTGDATYASGALRVVVTDRVSTVTDTASLGWIAFVDGRPANVITVSTGAAAALLQASRWDGVPRTIQRMFLVRALGRAIAHELGHYLLASRDHAAQGLMRGQLTADDIMMPRPSGSRLDRGQLARLHERVLMARREEAQSESLFVVVDGRQ